MTAIREVLPHMLLAAVVARSVAVAVIGVRSGGRRRRLLAAGLMQRVRHYRQTVLENWLLAALVPAVVVISPDLTFSDVGWRWPGAHGIDYLVCAYFALLFTIGGLRLRRRMLRGGTTPARAAIAPMVPQSRPERRWALGLTVTVAVTEEAVYRGLLIGAATRLYHLPTAIAVAVSLVLFIGVHAYQGRSAVLPVTILSALLTGLYLFSNSLLLVVVLHFWIDATALLMVPAHPTTPPADQPGTTKVATGRSEQELTGT